MRAIVVRVWWWHDPCMMPLSVFRQRNAIAASSARHARDAAAANASSIDACNANADFQEEVGCVFGSFHVISRKRKKSGRSWLRIGLPSQFALGK